METIQPGKHQRTLASRLDVNTFSATTAIIRVVIMIACQLALSYSFPIILRQGPARWFIRMMSAYFLVDGDVDQLLKHVMTFLAVLYACITARTLSEIPIAEAQAYNGDCVKGIQTDLLAAKGILLAKPEIQRANSFFNSSSFSSRLLFACLSQLAHCLFSGSAHFFCASSQNGSVHFLFTWELGRDILRLETLLQRSRSSLLKVYRM